MVGNWIRILKKAEYSGIRDSLGTDWHKHLKSNWADIHSLRGYTVRISGGTNQLLIFHLLNPYYYHHVRYQFLQRTQLKWLLLWNSHKYLHILWTKRLGGMSEKREFKILRRRQRRNLPLKSVSLSWFFSEYFRAIIKSRMWSEIRANFPWGEFLKAISKFRERKKSLSCASAEFFFFAYLTYCFFFFDVLVATAPKKSSQ